MRQKGEDLNERGKGGPGKSRGREAVIRTYCMRKQCNFNERGKKKRKK